MKTDSATIYFENALGRVVQHPRYACLLWHAQPQAGTAFRLLLGELLALCHHQRLGLVYTDHRGMPPVWVEECTWLVNRWLPQLATAVPSCRLAIVEDAETLSGAALRVALTHAHALALPVRCFEQEEPALHWLLNP
ncbi:hypothetical protein [Hymenobacter latericus]|uniref:hypothetical protein n=1 Tax=Hymenobacter sp. YIM 151858-1 TaxID=2987688 RepID=UPI002225DF83|nr:hypothetical protein [Hymenobacter sp. YIM 151858-1]UYZ61137.1 hypothetical protein OIS50_19400 [Hymenobacter sp. YIM 151858-1]